MEKLRQETHEVQEALEKCKMNICKENEETEKKKMDNEQLDGNMEEMR